MGVSRRTKIIALNLASISNNAQISQTSSPMTILTPDERSKQYKMFVRHCIAPDTHSGARTFFFNKNCGWQRDQLKSKLRVLTQLPRYIILFYVYRVIYLIFYCRLYTVYRPWALVALTLFQIVNERNDKKLHHIFFFNKTSDKSRK